MSTYSVYVCPEDGWLHVVGPDQEILTSAPGQVRCACGENHKCFPVHWPSEQYLTGATGFIPVERSLSGITIRQAILEGRS